MEGDLFHNEDGEELYSPFNEISNYDYNNNNFVNENRRSADDQDEEDIDEENKELKSEPNPTTYTLSADPNLLPEIVSDMEKKIAENKYDIESWTILISEYAAKLPIEQARGIYERFFAIFPTAGKFWKQYVEHEMSAKNYSNVESILSHCLLKCLHIELWRTYLQFVKLIKKDTPNGLMDIKKAYEFAIEKVGMDINSSQLWMDYIQFLSDIPATTEREKTTRMDDIRACYTRAIEIPMHNLETIWKDFDASENARDKLLAKSLLPKLTPKYAAAKQAYRERKPITDNLLRNMLATPPGKGIISFEKKQVSLWKKLIQCEKANSQRLDPAIHRQRVDFTFKQCLLCLLHYPEIWYDYANFYIELNAIDMAIEIYEQALFTLPDCMLLYFAYADFLESQNRFPQARKIYEKLIEKKPCSLSYIQLFQFSRRVENTKQARKEFRSVMKLESITYHVFISMAMIEYFSNNRIGAKNIFEEGMERFGDQPEYVIAYLRFLWNINEENNARSSFVTVLKSQTSRLPREKTRDIWNLFLEFEYQYGNLASISRVEKDKAAAFPGEDRNAILALVHRHKYEDLWPCDLAILESFGKDEELSEELKEKERIQHETNKSTLSKLVRPDVNSMLLYRPESMCNLSPSSLGLVAPQKSSSRDPPPSVLVFNAGNVSGFGNIPDSITSFISHLPTPDKYKGPQIPPESVMYLLQSISLPNLPAQSATLGKRSDPPPEIEKDSDSKKSKPSSIWRERQKKASGKGKFSK